jgi:hypothetical protein
MVTYVVKNGDWYLSGGTSWAVLTWSTDVRGATKYDSFETANDVVREAIENGHRPFGCSPEAAKAVKLFVCAQCGPSEYPSAHDLCDQREPD